MGDNMFKLYTAGNNITSYVGSLSWQNSIDELATKMSFEVAKSDTNYVNTYTPQIGDIVNFCTNIEIFRGIVIAVDDGERYYDQFEKMNQLKKSISKKLGFVRKLTEYEEAYISKWTEIHRHSRWARTRSVCLHN